MNIQGKEFDRGDLARHIAENTGIPEETCLQVIEWAAIGIADAIVEFDRVEVHNFGVFTVDNVAADSGTLPDGQPWEAPERLKVVFRPAKQFREQIARRMLKPVI
jgi:nucleoid DNA-binding protein